MRDEATALHRENEIVRRGFVPYAVTLRALKRVKGAIDLDRSDLFRRIFKLPLLGQPLREKNAAPRRIGPARNADADHPRSFFHAENDSPANPAAVAASSAHSAGLLRRPDGPGRLQSSVSIRSLAKHALSVGILSVWGDFGGRF